MTSGAAWEPELLSFAIRPNRSLGATGRKICLWLIAMTIFSVALGWAIVGAWMVLPFAGLEFGLVWLGFRILACHDEDYEILSVSGRAFRWECRDGNRIESMEGSCEWARLIRHEANGRAVLQLRYAGRTVTLADRASHEQRDDMYSRLSAAFRQVAPRREQ